MTKHISGVEISAWVDKQLDPRELAQFESHLRDCDECRAVSEEMSAMVEAFRSAGIAELPPYLWGRIAANLDKAAPPRRLDFMNRLLPSIGRAIRLHASAAVLAIVVLATGGAIFIEYRLAAKFEKRALAEMQLAQNSLAALNSETYNPFRAAGATSTKENPFSRDQIHPDVNPFRSATGDR